MCSPLIDPLEPRLHFASTRFAVIGDFGEVSQDAQDVADVVHHREPDFIITVGDNNYPSGAADTIDDNVGRYYHDFIHPYNGDFGAGSLTGRNRFFPVLGNHDHDTNSGKPYLDYFALPGNERYYTFKRGPVQFFMLDSDPRAADLGYEDETTSTQRSVQGQWLRRRLAESDARYKLVVMHHPPYTSGEHHDSSQWMQWPFRKWGATAVLAGHEHNYERIIKSGALPYFVNGLGGRSFRGFSDAPVSGSRVQFTGDFGAMFIGANDQRIVFKFITRGGQQIDRHEITSIPAPPTNLQAVQHDDGILLAWRDQSPTEDFFKIQRSTDGIHFDTIGRVEANETQLLDRAAEPSDQYTYRVRASNESGSSVWVVITPI